LATLWTVENQRFIRRVARLTFGMFGTLGSGDLEAQAVGSGIFVAPFMCLTAKHVSAALFSLEGRDGLPKTRTVSQHSAGLFQVLEPFQPGPNSSSALWHVDRSWTSPVTDIAVLQVSAEGELADQMQYDMKSKFLEWQVLPPPVGAEVMAIGFPGLGVVSNGGTELKIDAPFNVHRATVTEVFDEKRDAGMLNFPCFAVDQEWGHGFSGGPVTFEDRLCGIVSAGSGFDERSFVASLWPLTLMTFDNEFGQKTQFGQLLDDGPIKSSDWLQAKPIIFQKDDEWGNPHAHIDHPH
jgi:hypothetical protein